MDSYVLAPRRAESLKESINRYLWNEEKGCYRFLVGPFGTCDHQEGIGHSYALLFGIAGPQQAEAILRNLHVTSAGLPCAWPSFPRYDSDDGMAFARHAGTVWPQIQGFWAEAASRHGRAEVFAHELFNLARHARRDRQFAEIYHPLSGEIYGGIQEASDKGITLWEATSRQTWAATAYLRMILLGLVGMRFDGDADRQREIPQHAFEDHHPRSFFFAPLRKEVERYVMPPLRGTYEIVPAALGEKVVVHGALALAATNDTECQACSE